uniref:Con-Ins G2 n=1 Tax=Conus geographus TaxID=6491 RepID=INS2A_CONGE|nr:RecName: Full=Con-Ins G2; AltName: Full=Insulin 2; Contains: RecName: Full=Con-Ins G2 B chain; Contains: RecName: Full=Con-Ins G2 A chain; Flags: Precursor [Conus geographus]AJD85826.1 insulin 2 precursor [Conus geographus]
MTTSSYFLLVALGLLLYVRQSFSTHEHTCQLDDPAHPQGKCGSDLVNYHEEKCEEEEARRGGTNDGGKKRRRASPLWKRRRFLSMLKARAKRTGYKGIACECCQHYCTDQEFINYCPPVTESSSSSSSAA